MRRYNLNIPKVATLALVLAVLGVLGFCGYRIYDTLAPRLHWQVEPAIIHGYLIAAGWVEKDPDREYLNDFSIAVRKSQCQSSAATRLVGEVEAYSLEEGSQLDISDFRLDGHYFSVVVPLDPDWIKTTARQCSLDLIVSGNAPRAFSYGAFDSMQIKIISLSGNSE